jgi:glycosyltransferase involved in cell wall biosynthesis
MVTPRERRRDGNTEKTALHLASVIADNEGYSFAHMPGDRPVWNPRIYHELRQAVAKADIVWLHDTMYRNAIVAFHLAQKAGKPVVVTQHGAPTPKSLCATQPVTKLADWSMTRRMLAKAQQVTFASDIVANSYFRHMQFAAPAKIIPNGIDLRTFHMPLPEKRRYLRARFALRDSQPVLLFAGGFSEQQGLPVIRALAQQMVDMRFWLAGDGPINPEKWFLPNVQVFRGRSGEGLAELYHAADMLIEPGYDGRFPTAIQEASACGLPSICSPALAAGSSFAKPYLCTAEVFPTSLQRTADLWRTRLNGLRAILPLAELKIELADLASMVWSDDKIASCYADIFHGFRSAA